MLSRAARRSLIDLPTHLPPTFLLPFRARLSTTSSGSTAPTSSQTPTPEAILSSPNAVRKTVPEKPIAQEVASEHPGTASQLPITAQAASTQTPTPSSTIKALLPLLRVQAPHYITAHIYGRPYLLTEGDELRLPFLMHGVEPGDVIRLNRATHLGSREFTLKAAAPVKGTRDAPGRTNYLDERLFTCRAVVMGTESEPMRIMEKTKRRQRHVKHVKSKHRYTVLRITELEVKDVEEAGLEGVVAERAEA